MQLEANSEPIRESQSQDAAVNDAHLLDLLIILSKRRKFIFLFTLCVAILAAISVLLVPNKYTAVTVILPPNETSSIVSALTSQLSGSGDLAAIAGAGLGIKNTADLFVSLFRSRTIEDAMVQRFALMAKYRVKRISDARQTFEENSSVVSSAKDGLLRIAVTDRDPNLAAEMANAYVDEFRKLSANLAITEASRRRAFFQQQLLEANEKLAAAEDAMKRSQQSTGVLQLDSQARSLIESAAAIRGQIAAKEVQLQGMRSYATDENPQMVTAEQQLVALKGQLAKLSGTNTNAGSDIFVPKGNIPEAGIEYLRKVRDLKYSETVVSLLGKEFEMAKLDEARQGAVIQITDLAIPPDKKSSPHRTFAVALAMLIAFIVAILWTFASERWAIALRNPVVQGKIQTLRTLHSKKL